MPWRRDRLPTAVFWPGEFHGLDSPWVAKSRARLSSFHFYTSTVEVVGSAVGQTWFEGLIPSDKLGDPGKLLNISGPHLPVCKDCEIIVMKGMY